MLFSWQYERKRYEKRVQRQAQARRVLLDKQVLSYAPGRRCIASDGSGLPDLNTALKLSFGRRVEHTAQASSRWLGRRGPPTRRPGDFGPGKTIKRLCHCVKPTMGLHVRQNRSRGVAVLARQCKVGPLVRGITALYRQVRPAGADDPSSAPTATPSLTRENKDE